MEPAECRRSGLIGIAFEPLRTPGDRAAVGQELALGKLVLPGDGANHVFGGIVLSGGEHDVASGHLFTDPPERASVQGSTGTGLFREAFLQGGHEPGVEGPQVVTQVRCEIEIQTEVHPDEPTGKALVGVDALLAKIDAVVFGHGASRTTMVRQGRCPPAAPRSMFSFRYERQFFSGNLHATGSHSDS